jgi:hypothetical protein
MSLRLRFSFFVLLSGWLLSFSSAAQAGVVISYGGFASPHYSGAGQVRINSSSSWVNLSQGGGFLWNVISNDTGIVLDEYVSGKLLTFCLELSETFSSGTYNVDLISLDSAPKPGVGLPSTGMGTTKADQLSILWAKYIGDAMTSAANSAAFQLAIWMIEYDNLELSSHFGSGTPQTIKNLANSWVDYVKTAPSDAERADLMAFSKTGFQDQLVAVIPPSPGPSPVPEPSSVAVWLLVGAAVGIGLRRRRTMPE